MNVKRSIIPTPIFLRKLWNQLTDRISKMGKAKAFEIQPEITPELRIGFSAVVPLWALRSPVVIGRTEQDLYGIVNRVTVFILATLSDRLGGEYRVKRPSL